MIIVGAKYLGWYIPEICALFIALGVLSSIISGMGAQKSVDAFVKGCKIMLHAALVIAMSRAIYIVAAEGKIIDSMLHAVSGMVEGVPKAISVQLMFFTQGFINFFMPSGSGQAALTMPVMTPLSDILGISRQTAVLAFQLGDGLFNLIIPTSGITMGVLAIGGVPFNVWIKWVWKLMLVCIIVSMIFLALPVSVFEWH